MRHLPQSEWQVLIKEHHDGYIDWQTYEANQARLAANTRPGPHNASNALREGSALLQSLASCGHCGRRLKTHYRGRNATPGYHCAGKTIVEGRGCYCLNVGGVQIDEAVAKTFLAALEPAKLAATLAAAERLERDTEERLKQWRLAAERAAYEAKRAERRYLAVDPDNRLVARGLEREWEKRLADLEAANEELARRLDQRPRVLGPEERQRLLALGADLAAVWDAPTTTPRDRKELLRALIEEVILSVDRQEPAAHLTVRWKGGALTDVDVPLPRSRPATIRTDEETLDLVRRLATLYPDTVIAGILNRQGRTTARGHRFEANRVASLRTHWRIPCFQRTPEVADGEVMTIAAAAAVLNIAPSTLHRWLNDGLIAGEQVTPGAPWRIRITDELKARFTEAAGEGFITMQEATRALGVTRQTVLQRVKRGEIEAAHVTKGGKTGLRLKLPDRHPGLFEPT
jgi:hypothetical protein